jgi:hypothetical protein
MNIWVYVVGLFVLSLVARKFTRKPAFSAPPRIQLFPATASGKHATDLLSRKPELDVCSFKRIGSYRVDPLNIVASAFVNEQESICAVIYHHPKVGCFIDMVCKSTQDRSFTATTASGGSTLDQREGQEKVFDHTLTIAGMFELVKSRRPEGPYEQWNAENFASKFEAAYAEEMDWRARRGGVTRDEVRRTADASGKRYSEEEIQQATTTLQDKYAQSRGDTTCQSSPAAMMAPQR